ncbi:MAG: hypothetical protein GKR96_05350 [Gammaproteobacteria bacterium]|nr:hypothetical protein [Gammaproteobacteria bacterium]
MNRPEKLLGLESLRGIAALSVEVQTLSVALLHLNVESHFRSSFAENATLMVDFFCVVRVCHRA